MLKSDEATGKERTTLIRRTKIVATLGPATGTPEGIAGLIGAGANVIRVNSSHGTPEQRATWIAAVREAAAAADVAVAVLVDLQGPRIRVGKLAAPRVLRAGETVVFAPEDVARDDELPTTYADLATDVRPGARILLDDGLLSLEVTRIVAPRVEGRVVDGGTLTSHKGMNLPGLHVSAPALTEKDREDAEHAAAAGADYLGLSFVRRAEDLGELRALVPPDVRLVAKIEIATALEDLGRILEACDAVMVARGDLGVELPFEEVPAVQKRLIREANRYGKPVITATQMLESMVHHPRPTRAEASDVANAILDGTDAVMLSAETAVGEYPFEAVRAMDRIIRETERQGPAMGVGARDERRLTPGETVSVEDAIAIGTSAVARMLRTPLIVTLTSGGFTSRKVAALRTPVPILAVTTQPTTYRQLALVWGVTPVLVDRVPGYDAMLAVVRDLILKRGYVVRGAADRVRLPHMYIVRPARPAHPHGGADRVGGSAPPHRHAARAAAAARDGGRRLRRRCAVHARARRSRPRHRRPARLLRAPAGPPRRLRRGGHARRVGATLCVHLRPRSGPPGDEQARARRAAPGARPRSRDRGDAGTRTRPAARRPHGARLPRGTDCVPHRRESDSGGGARPAGGARGAGAERVAAAPAPVAPLHPGGRRRGAADRRAAHLPHA